MTQLNGARGGMADDERAQFEFQDSDATVSPSRWRRAWIRAVSKVSPNEHWLDVGHDDGRRRFANRVELHSRAVPDAQKLCGHCSLCAESCRVSD